MNIHTIEDALKKNPQLHISITFKHGFVKGNPKHLSFDYKEYVITIWYCESTPIIEICQAPKFTGEEDLLTVPFSSHIFSIHPDNTREIMIEYGKIDDKFKNQDLDLIIKTISDIYQ